MEGHVRPGDSVVELGIGTGFLANYLRTKGVTVTTLDIDPAKSPDIVIDAVDYRPAGPFDHFCAFEVFEHMEFEELGVVLDNIKDYVTGGLFISLPLFSVRRCIFDVKVLRLRKSMYVRWKKSRLETKNHRWELGYGGFDEKRLGRECVSRGFVPGETLEYLSWRYFHFSKDH